MSGIRTSIDVTNVEHTGSAGRREAHVIADSEALSIIESNVFDETALAPIPFCIHQTSNRSLVKAIVKKSGLALAAGEIREYQTLTQLRFAITLDTYMLHLAFSGLYTCRITPIREM